MKENKQESYVKLILALLKENRRLRERAAELELKKRNPTAGLNSNRKMDLN
jgi:hypothetical protein